MTKTHTAQILHFDPTQVRPGIRNLLIEAKLRIADSLEAGEWCLNQKITPDLILDQIPGLKELFALDDGAVTESAMKTSLLSLHAIHSGVWQSIPSLTFFMQLQVAAVRLQGHPLLSRTA